MKTGKDGVFDEWGVLQLTPDVRLVNAESEGTCGVGVYIKNKDQFKNEHYEWLNCDKELSRHDVKKLDAAFDVLSQYIPRSAWVSLSGSLEPIGMPGDCECMYCRETR